MEPNWEETKNRWMDKVKGDNNFRCKKLERALSR